jgi:hypothetical protein
MPPDLREALDSAFEEHADTEIPASPEPTTPEPDAAIETTPEPETAEQAAERARDALGRFSKADQPDGKGQVPGAPGTPPVAAPVQPQADRMPAGIPATVREVWGQLPPAVREYTAQREMQVQQVLSQSAFARNAVQQFQQIVAPYQQAIQIEAGGDPLRAVQGLLDTAARLRFGTTAEKAQTLAQLVNAYGVDITALDSALVGAPMPQQQGFDPNAVQQAVQQQLAPFFQQAQQRRQQQEQQVVGAVKSEIGTFAADKANEFFDDVRDLMADVVELAERQGYTMDLKHAYDRACLLHPEVSKVILARQQGQNARNLTTAAQRAKAAAVGVTGAAPVGNPDPAEPSTVRDAIEAAIESHSRV